MKKLGRLFALCLTAVLSLSACTGNGGTESTTVETKQESAVRVGTLLALGTATPLVSEKLNYFQEAGLEVTVSQFSDGAALMEAFAAGELDLALVGIAPAATWFQKGIDLKVVAGTNGGGHVVMTRPGTGIKSVKDLKGKKVAEPSIATVTDALLRSKVLKSANLNPEKDVTLIPGMKPADMATALMATKEVDAIITWEPYASQAQQEYPDIQIVYDAAPEIKEETGRENFYPGNVLVASGAFIENHEKELKTYLDVHKKTIDFMNSDVSANEILSEILQLDVHIIEHARTRTDFQYDINTEAAMEILSWSVQQSYLQHLPDETTFFQLGES
ncbi:MAG: ABC transporter substrate-binding protein [Lachnospiraceae bacterium]